MNKLTGVEAQRVLAVLGETLEKLELLACTPTNYSSSLNVRLEEAGCEEVATLLDDTYQLEESMHVINSGGIGVNSTRINTSAAADLRQKLGSATRAYCRALRDNTAAVDELRRVSNEPSSDISQCLHWLSELRDLYFRTLTTTVEDEGSKLQLLEEVSAREKEADEDRKTLTTQLNMERREKNRAVSQLDAVLSKLKVELQEIKMSTSEESELLEKETKEEMEAAQARHEATITELEVSIAKLGEDLSKLKEDAASSEAAVRKKKAKAELEVQGWVGRFDKEMGEKQAEIDELRTLFEEERRKLLELEEHFEKVDAERELIKEEEESFAEEKARILAEDAVEDDAATGVQKLWRGKLAREHVASLKKGGAKKGKKGKKGKK